jgi:hypothetical protein
MESTVQAFERAFRQAAGSPAAVIDAVARNRRPAPATDDFLLVRWAIYAVPAALVGAVLLAWIVLTGTAWALVWACSRVRRLAGGPRLMRHP